MFHTEIPTSKNRRIDMFTLNDLRNIDVGRDAIERIRRYCDGSDPETILFSIGDIAIIDLDDALWALRLVPQRNAILAVMPAMLRVAHKTNDTRIHSSVETILAWLRGETADLVEAECIANFAADDAEENNFRETKLTAIAASWLAVACMKTRRDAIYRAAHVLYDCDALHVSDLIVAFPPIMK